MKHSIFFDLDGTLWDTSREVVKIYKEISIKYNILVTEQNVKSIMGLTEPEIVDKFFKEAPDIGYSFLKECHETENKYLAKNGAKIFENTISTLEELSKNYKLYLVSNCQKGYMEAFFEYYKLEKYFSDYEYFGNTLKPKDYNIKLVMERNNIEKAIYIGDTIKDMEASQKANIPFVWAKYGFGICEEYDYSIDDISELINLVKTLE